MKIFEKIEKNVVIKFGIFLLRNCNILCFIFMTLGVNLEDEDGKSAR